MGIMNFLKTIIGQSDEEIELRKRVNEAIINRKERTASVEDAKRQLKEAQEQFRKKAEDLSKDEPEEYNIQTETASEEYDEKENQRTT